MVCPQSGVGLRAEVAVYLATVKSVAVKQNLQSPDTISLTALAEGGEHNAAAFFFGFGNLAAAKVNDATHSAVLGGSRYIAVAVKEETAAAIKRASVLAMYAGADFIKTSTGKIEPAATPEAAYVMCRAIKEYHEQCGRLVGFKAAGGISTVDDALTYYTIVREILGEEYIKKGLFRIGTSRLANLLVSDILGEDCKPF